MSPGGMTKRVEHLYTARPPFLRSHPRKKWARRLRDLSPPDTTHTKRRDLVYEPFLGSGTTLAAAELTERVCCGMELDPKYVDVVVQRWGGGAPIGGCRS